MAVQERKKPGPAPKTLSTTEHELLSLIAGRIRELEEELARARLEYAKAVRVIGISAVARHFEVTRQAVQDRIAGYEKAAEVRGE